MTVGSVVYPDPSAVIVEIMNEAGTMARKEDLLNFLTKEFGDFDKWNKIINNFQGDNFKQTNKRDYLLDEEIKKEFKDFLVEEYKLYDYLLTRVYL